MNRRSACCCCVLECSGWCLSDNKCADSFAGVCVQKHKRLGVMHLSSFKNFLIIKTIHSFYSVGGGVMSRYLMRQVLQATPSPPSAAIHFGMKTSRCQNLLIHGKYKSSGSILCVQQFESNQPNCISDQCMHCSAGAISIAELASERVFAVFVHTCLWCPIRLFLIRERRV